MWEKNQKVLLILLVLNIIRYFVGNIYFTLLKFLCLPNTFSFELIPLKTLHASKWNNFFVLYSIDKKWWYPPTLRWNLNSQVWLHNCGGRRDNCNQEAFKKICSWAKNGWAKITPLIFRWYFSIQSGLLCQVLLQ